MVCAYAVDDGTYHVADETTIADVNSAINDPKIATIHFDEDKTIVLDSSVDIRWNTIFRFLMVST